MRKKYTLLLSLKLCVAQDFYVVKDGQMRSRNVMVSTRCTDPSTTEEGSVFSSSPIPPPW